MVWALVALGLYQGLVPVPALGLCQGQSLGLYRGLVPVASLWPGQCYRPWPESPSSWP